MKQNKVNKHEIERRPLAGPTMMTTATANNETVNGDYFFAPRERYAMNIVDNNMFALQLVSAISQLYRCYCLFFCCRSFAALRIFNPRLYTQSSILFGFVAVAI